MLELIGLLVRVARQRRRDGLKLAVSVFLADQMSNQFESVFVYWCEGTPTLRCCCTQVLSRSSDCQELLTRSVERRVDRPA